MRDRVEQWMRSTPPMAWGSLFAAIAALAAIGIMNIAFGEYIGATESGKRIYSAVSIICATAGTVVFGLMSGKLWGEKRRAAAFFPIFVFVIAIAWDLASVSGFNATERLSAAASRKAAIEADKKDAEERAKLRERYVERLQGVATVSGHTRSERRDFLSAAAAEIAKPAAVAPPVRLLADAQAEMIVKGLALIGRHWTVDEVQLAIIAHLSVLLVLIEAVGFYYTTYLRALHLREPQRKRGGGGGDPGEGENDRRDNVRQFPAPLLSATNHARSIADSPSIAAPIAQTIDDRSELATQRSAAAVVDGAPPRMPFADYREFLRQIVAGERQPMSQRQIAERVGRTQPTVNVALRKVRQERQRAIAARDRHNRRIGAFGGIHIPASA